MRVIHNCHTHTFTVQNVPSGLLPLGLIGGLQNPKTAALLRIILRTTNPIYNFYLRTLGSPNHSGQLNRLAAFLEMSDCRHAKEILTRLEDQYPQGTRFVALSIDMDHMGAGQATEDYLKQLQDLRDLKASRGERLIPFVCADPRRGGVTDLVREQIEEHGFGGIKLYPSLGFFPWDERLDQMYEWAQTHQIPIITHCSRGGMYFKHPINPEHRIHPITKKTLSGRTNAEFARNYTHPLEYEHLLKKFPDLKLCLAHFGGHDQWQRYLEQKRRLPLEQQTWVSTVMNLMYKHKNLYTDIAYTAADHEALPMLKVLINDSHLRERILFGSDFFVVRMESTEREFSIRLRGFLGEDDFWQIAQTNPIKFLT